jgi:hypothetical protein
MPITADIFLIFLLPSFLPSFVDHDTAKVGRTVAPSNYMTR